MLLCILTFVAAVAAATFAFAGTKATPPALAGDCDATFCGSVLNRSGEVLYVSRLGGPGIRLSPGEDSKSSLRDADQFWSRQYRIYFEPGYGPAQEYSAGTRIRINNADRVLCENRFVGRDNVISCRDRFYP